jgi:hypothetical protein
MPCQYALFGSKNVVDSNRNTQAREQLPAFTILYIVVTQDTSKTCTIRKNFAGAARPFNHAQEYLQWSNDLPFATARPR